MRGNDLPIHVTEEHRELPFIHTTADDRIWSGVIDHLYRLENGEWVLDDYKTDAKIDPQRYETQMRHYDDAARAWTKQPPKLRLVYLRHAKVVQLDT
jgi:ATP-dependent exoDNAse (exonuclease V) beta subunit